jgi:MCP family monocarboxylic acid transporter-like MFS transporter 10
MAIFTAVAGITTVAWPYAKDQSQLIAIATIHGYALRFLIASCPVD